jgi:bifunctional non-homologous end joining protein LigD
VTNAQRIVFPAGSVTKGELAAYYTAIAEELWPHVAHRPVSLLRTTGQGQVFLQRHPMRNVTLPGLSDVRSPDAADPYLAPTNRAAAVHAFGQFSCVELHTWGCLDRDPEHADRLVFDLDPDPALPWARVRDAAVLVRELLQALELESFVKTTGGKGLHVVVPLASPRPAWPEVAEFSRSVARHLARARPRLFSAQAGAANRRQKIYIDHLRNRDAATTVAAYSPRLRPAAPVSMPLEWTDLRQTDLRDAHFNLRNALAHASSRGGDSDTPSPATLKLPWLIVDVPNRGDSRNPPTSAPMMPTTTLRISPCCASVRMMMLASQPTIPPTISQMIRFIELS